jgi:integrase
LPRTWRGAWKPRRSSESARNTFRDYGKVLRKFVIPALGSRRVDQVTPKEIRALYQSMADQGLCRTVQHTHSILRHALQGAVTDRLLTWNPAAGTKLPKNDRPAQGDSLEALFHVLLSTGLRPGEALALRWEDLNLPDARLAVRQALVGRGDGSYVIGKPKTKSSYRRLTLPPTVVAALHAHRIRQAEEILAAGPEYERIDLVFANSVGRPTDLTRARNAFLLLAWIFSGPACSWEKTTGRLLSLITFRDPPDEHDPCVDSEWHRNPEQLRAVRPYHAR